MTARSDVLDWLTDLAAALVTDSVDAADFGNRIAAAVDLDATAFAAETLQLMRILGESVASADDLGRIVAPGDDDAFALLVAVGLSIAAPRIDWPSRPAARVARDRLVTAGDAGLLAASAMGAAGAELFGWLAGLISVAVRIVSDRAANAVPMVRVETGVSLPSTVLAYRLYGDAARAGALTEIAGSMTPMLMPAAFEALER